MPRTSRAVAQRLAAQKPRKRRAPRSAGVAPAVADILAEAAPGPALDEQDAAPVRPASSSELRRRGAAESAPRLSARRRYADYAEEYRYVWGDLRRILLVAGGLLLLLVVLALFVG